MHQKPRRLFQRDERLVLIQDRQRAVLGGVVRLRLVQTHADLVAGMHDEIGEHRLAVDGVRMTELQAAGKAGGHPQLPPQDGKQARFPLGRMGQDHRFFTFFGISHLL